MPLHERPPWAEVSGYPDVKVVDPNHCLAEQLPATYEFENIAASYYQFRVTDPVIEIVCDNGDGYHMLFSKAISSGHFDYCINSSYVAYWAGNDLAWMTAVVYNMLRCQVPCCVPVRTATWGGIKNTYRDATR